MINELARKPCDNCDKVRDHNRCSSYRKCTEYRNWFRMVLNDVVSGIKLAGEDDENEPN